MFADLAHRLSDWLALHAHIAGLVVGLISCVESLAVVGMFVPGTVLLFGAGALIATGSLAFWPTLAWAVGGAVLGDGLSYWLGHRFRERIPRVWPLRRHPELLERGRGFLESHGGKSIVFGRFVGPVRAIVPMVAGMLGMSRSRFTAMNVLSAFVWAPAHLLPGMAFGASLALAGAVAGRLAVLLAAVILAGWLLVWLSKQAYRALYGHASSALGWATGWSKRHPHASWLVSDLVEEDAPAPRALAAWFALLALATWLFGRVLQDVLSGAPLLQADAAVFHLFEGLRTSPGDAVMVVVGELGHPLVLAIVAAAVGALLLARRSWRDAGYWLGGIALAAGAVFLLRALLGSHPPPGVPPDAWSGFPSPRVTLATVTYGLLASFAARELPRKWRPIPYVAAVMLVGAITFSRLYLGAQALSGAAGGLALGLAWMALVSIAEHRHVRAPLAVGGVGTAGLVALSAAALVVVPLRFATELRQHEPSAPVTLFSEESWWNGDVRRLPAFRTDLAGHEEEPLNVQWAGSPDEVRAALERHGWHAPTRLGFANALHWLLPAPGMETLPVLPKLHEGRREALLLVHDDPQRPGSQLVLRLWSSGVRLTPDGAPVLVGTVTGQALEKLPLLRFPRDTADYESAIGALASAAPVAKRAPENGTLLVRER